VAHFRELMGAGDMSRDVAESAAYLIEERITGEDLRCLPATSNWDRDERRIQHYKVEEALFDLRLTTRCRLNTRTLTLSTGDVGNGRRGDPDVSGKSCSDLVSDRGSVSLPAKSTWSMCRHGGVPN
jgi:hypothetical protein